MVFHVVLSLVVTEVERRDQWRIGGSLAAGQYATALQLGWSAQRPLRAQPGIVFLAYQSLSAAVIWQTLRLCVHTGNDYPAGIGVRLTLLQLPDRPEVEFPAPWWALRSGTHESRIYPGLSAAHIELEGR